MRKSKSWAPSRGGAACADTPEGRDGCCCDADTPGAGDSCAVNDNKLSCSVASIQIEHGFIGLTRTRSATAPGTRQATGERLNCEQAHNQAWRRSLHRMVRRVRVAHGRRVWKYAVESPVEWLTLASPNC